MITFIIITLWNIFDPLYRVYWLLTVSKDETSKCSWPFLTATILVDYIFLVVSTFILLNHTPVLLDLLVTRIPESLPSLSVCISNLKPWYLSREAKSVSRTSQKPSPCGRKSEQAKHKNQRLWTSYGFRNLGQRSKEAWWEAMLFNLEKQNTMDITFENTHENEVLYGVCDRGSVKQRLCLEHGFGAATI